MTMRTRPRWAADTADVRLMEHERPERLREATASAVATFTATDHFVATTSGR